MPNRGGTYAYAPKYFFNYWVSILYLIKKCVTKNICNFKLLKLIPDPSDKCRYPDNIRITQINYSSICIERINSKRLTLFLWNCYLQKRK